MAEEGTGKILHIDADWKTEAALEKERLAVSEKKAEATGTADGEAGANFLELVNLVAMQAAIGLGGYQGQGGERIPPNTSAAKFHIDLLEILQKKTEGNLTAEEQRTLDAVLYELRMQFVQVASGPAPPAEADKKGS